MNNKYVFVENEEIARKNSKLSSINKETNLLNYDNKKIIRGLVKNSKNKVLISKKNCHRERYSHCRNCNGILEHPHSRVWGYCPLCDML